MPFLPGLVLLALLSALPSSVTGQAPRIGGVSIERFYLDGYRFYAVDYRRTDIREGAGDAGIDFALGAVPNTLAGGIVLLQLDAGLARALPVGPGTLILKGGVGNFLALGAETAFYPGVQGGVAAIIPLEKRARVRVDLTRHWYLTGDPISFWSLGFGLAVSTSSQK